jgi:hypothetical protein
MSMRWCVLLVGLAGCSPDKPQGELPPLQPAMGTVVRGGKAAGPGLVQFRAEPDKPDLVVNGEVRADGTFELQTLHATSQKKGKGAPAGTYRVTYIPAATEQNQMVTPVEVPLPVTIKDGPNELTVELGKK